MDIAQPLDEVLHDVARHYELGRIERSQLITQGYDDLNVLLVCERGRYVAKFFNKSKGPAIVEDYVRVQMALARHRLPVPHIHAMNGAGLFRVTGRHQETLVCVSQFFAGESFIAAPPLRDDILAITRFLAALHQLPFDITPSYDSWGTLNLPGEFARKQALVSDETRRLVAPLADAIESMEFGRARRRIIHGDLQRKHVLKDGRGRYCILDFGCMDFSYPIVDLGIFLALFCLEGSTPTSAQQIIADVLEAYKARAPLPTGHIALLGTLIRATWASYLLAADFLMRGGDRTRQTRQWRHFALTSLRAFDGRL
ncbi:MAG TPA: phosphotransferase [Ktedonobacterales bacterium]|nr:phosphotransferase [Ktedonobacterales bacterium]